MEETISEFTKTANLVNEIPELYFKTAPNKYMIFEERIKKSKAKAKEMSKGINKSQGFDSQECGRSI